MSTSTKTLTPEQQSALTAFNSYLQTRTGDTLTASQQTAPKQLTDAEITEYLKAVTQSPSSSGKDITANILKDWGQGNRYTAERILGDAATYNVSDERLAGILGIAPEGIASTRDKIVNYRKLAGTLTPSVGEYLDPVTGKDYSPQMGLLLAAKLDDLGLNEFGQLEKQVTPAKQVETSGRGLFGNQALAQLIAAEQDPEYTERTRYFNKATGKEIDPILFDDKAGTKYVLTEQGIQKQSDPNARLAAQLRSYVDPSSTGGAWGTKGGKKSPPGFGPEGMMRQIASRVQGATGVSDINQLGFRNVPVVKQVRYDDVGRPYYEEPATDEYGNYSGVVSRILTDDEKNKVKNGTIQLDITAPEIYNKATGQKIRDGNYIDLGGWGEGPGMTYASMTFDDKGKPKISTYGEDTNTLSQFQPLMTLASIIPSPIQPFAIAANAANAAYNYGNFIPAIMAAVPYTGILDSIAGTASNVAGPAGELASNSGIAGLAQNLGVSTNLANTIGKVGAQSLLGGTLSAAQGKGFLPGAKSGVVSGLVNEGVNAGVNAVAPDALKGLGSLATPAKSLISSMLIAKAMNRPFDLEQYIQNAAINYGLNQAIDAGGKELGIDPKQQAALMKFLNFAAPMIAARRKP
jgi:hypothetical protein